MSYTRLFILLTFAMCIAMSLTTAQEDIPIMTLVYMHAPDGAEYEEIEREIWMPVHAQRIREGTLLNWQLYEVVNAMENGNEFNYLIVETYPNWESTEAPYADIDKIIEEVHGSTSVDYLFERTEQSREMIKQDLWTWQFGTESDSVVKMSDIKYVVVDWMDIHPGQEADYIDMERKYFLPVHQKRVDADKILGWGLWTKLGYSELPGSIDAATSANFASYKDLWNSYPEDAWSSVHGYQDEGEIYEKLRETRLMTGSAILRLVNFVNPETATDK